MNVLPGFNLGASWQRGDTFGFMAHLQFELGKPLRKKDPDPPLRSTFDDRTALDMNDGDAVRNRLATIQEAIEKTGFDNVKVYANGDTFFAEFENNRYVSNPKAVGRALRILHFYAAPETEKLTVILKNRQIPMLRVSVHPDHLKYYLLGDISDETFSDYLKVEITDQDAASTRGKLALVEDNGINYDWGIKPNFESYLNDPSGVFKFRVGIQPHITAELWKGAAVNARYDIPFYSNIESSNEILPDAVRSDVWRYAQDDLTFERLMFDQAFRITDRTFGRLSLGYLETMYAGVSGEILRFFGNGDLAVGIEADWARKREPGTHFALLDQKETAILGNLYYHFRPIDTTFHAQYGEFLGGDDGWLFTVSREYDTGAVVGFWYTLTDTEELSGEFNRDYNEKGVFVSIPANVFTARETRTRYTYALSPWTRDAAARIAHWEDLYSLFNDLTPANFKGDISDLKK